MALDMMNGFQERAFSDPMEVTDAIVNIVEMLAGQHPLPTPVGADVQRDVNSINEAATGV
jgi:hypothetical protein